MLSEPNNVLTEDYNISVSLKKIQVVNLQNYIILNLHKKQVVKNHSKKLWKIWIFEFEGESEKTSVLALYTKWFFIIKTIIILLFLSLAVK